MSGLILCGLLAVNIAAPWQYLHDDNGAFYSSIARSHLVGGLSATRGQDFLTERAGGALRPYLHHPPLLALYLAAVFGLVGDDSPAVARTAMALLHLASFFLFCATIRGVTRSALVSTWCMLGFAVVPMSSFFGKMPNHEPLSLMFVMLALFAYTKRRDTGHGFFWLPVASVAWALAVLSAWHAAFIGLSFAGYAACSKSRRDPTYAAVALTAVVIAIGLAGAHLLWANHGASLPSQRAALAYWLRGPQDGSSLSAVLSDFGKPLAHGRRFFNAPWFMAVAYFLRPLLQPAKSSVDPFVAALWSGTLLYWLCFHYAVGVHAYQLFFLLPGVLLASGLLLDDVVSTIRPTRPGAAAAILFGAVLMTAGFSVARLSKIYAKSDAYAVQTTQSLSQRYL